MNKLLKRRIVMPLAALSVIACLSTSCSIKNNELCFANDSVVQEYIRTTLQNTRTMRDVVDAVVIDWQTGTITFEEASEILIQVQDTSSVDVADYAKERLAFITQEKGFKETYILATEHYLSGRYPQALECLSSIQNEYSEYDNVLKLSDVCAKHVLQLIGTPQTEEDYQASIKLIEECQKFYDSVEFSECKEKLETGLAILVDIRETIEAATELYDSGQIEESFVLLALGIEMYPDSERLATTLVDYHDHYIISVTKEALELCNEERYKDALKIVEAAIEEYDSPEFQTLRDSIKEESNFLRRLKNDIIGTFTSLSNEWSKEEFDVKQATNDAGAYIIKSGKKLALGDYSDENITLLSFGGNIAATLTGTDLLFDLRDLSYDITHWGEDEYFAVWLATDVVALLPVIGVVKYISHFKTTAKGLEAGAELVDSAADIAKNGENTAELADTISDMTKTNDDIIESVKKVKNSENPKTVVHSIMSRIFKDYTLIDTPNQKLLGKKHPETGVKFVLTKLNFSDGRKIKGVFPKFDSFMDIQLPQKLYKADANVQKEYCLKKLQEKINNPLYRNFRKQFTEEQLQTIKNGIQPKDFAWHHNEKEGLMQLVDFEIHDKTHHKGGMSLWGIDSQN